MFYMMSPGVIRSPAVHGGNGSYRSDAITVGRAGTKKSFPFCSDMKQRIFFTFHIGTSIAGKRQDCDPDPPFAVLRQKRLICQRFSPDSRKQIKIFRSP
jgi:hypothetical protein